MPYSQRMKFICLVRAVNVGGHNRLPMALLKSLCTKLGCTGTATYLQSGNAVFLAPASERSTLAARIEGAIRKEAGIDVRVILRTDGELRKAIAANPFPAAAESDPSHTMIVFLEARPSAAAAAALLAAHDGPEEMKLIGSELFIHYPAGIQKSKLTNTLIERKLGVTSTARNWNSVTRLLEMAEGLRIED